MNGIKGASRLALAALFAVAVEADSALAQGFAIRSGAHINPDQMSIGAQYERGPIVDRVWLQPNVDLGFGDNATLVAVNADIVYRRPLSRTSVWTGYAGGGPAINWYKLLGYSQTEAGATAVGGVMHRSGVFTEIRVGFLESPRMRFGAGYAFGRKTNAAAPRRTPPRRK